MADFAQGDYVRDYVTIVDENFVGISTANWSVDDALDPDGQDYGVEITNIGDGGYRVQFLATKVGTYYWRIQTTNTTPIFAFENTFVVGPFNLFGIATGMAAEGITLFDLVQMLASEMSDLIELQATQDGALDGSNFVDQERLSVVPASTLRGSAFITTSPVDSANYMVERRVLDSSEESQMLTFRSSLPAQTRVGHTAWVVNLHSEGYWLNQYISALNNAILQASSRHPVPIEYVYPSSLNGADPTIPIPQQMYLMHSVYAYHLNGQVQEIPAALGSVYGPGWTFDEPSKSITLTGYWPAYLDGWNIRLAGYGKEDRLRLWTDVTSMDPAYLIKAAAANLKWGKGDQRRYPEAANLDNRADTMLPSILTPMHPNTIRVR